MRMDQEEEYNNEMGQSLECTYLCLYIAISTVYITSE